MKIDRLRKLIVALDKHRDKYRDKHRAAVMLASGVFLLNLCAFRAAAQPIDSLASEPALRAHTKFLSDDKLEGRGTGAKGGELAAKYIAEQLKRAGVQGGAENKSYFQQVSLFGVKADPASVLTARGTDGREQRFKFAEDFVAFTGAQRPEVAVSGELVFVGYGIDAPEQRWNDYKGAPEDYRNKILVMLVNDPPATAAEPNLFGGRALTYSGRWTYQ
ncbi:MAG: hypothetical protein WKF30_10190 [Pyrinomonadaceae bacterium]